MIWFLGFVALVLYVLFDVHYFARVIWVYLQARVVRSKIRFLDSSEIYGICMPSDADFLLTHMNNARYLREFDFARFDLLTRNGVMPEVMSRRGGGIVVSAASVRYRLPLMLGSSYKVVSIPIWWDDKFCYLEQRLVTLSDNIVRTVAFIKMAMVKVDNFEELVQKVSPGTLKPPLRDDLQKWIESNDMSSERMKKELVKDK